MCKWLERKLLILNTTWASRWIWHGQSNVLGLDSFEEPREENGVDDQPTPISSASLSPSICPITINFAVTHRLAFSTLDVTNMQSFIEN